MTTMAERSRLTRSQSVAMARRNLHRRIVQVEDVLELVDAEDQRDLLDGPHQLAQPLDDPVRRVGIRARDDPAQQPAVVLGEVLAAEILEHAGLDPRVVALEIKQGLDEIDVDRAEPVVEDDPVGQLGDQLVEAAAGPGRRRGAGPASRAGRRATTRPGRSRAASAPWSRTGTRRTACRANRSGC